MYFRISNTADKNLLEAWSNASLKYPNLYKPQIIINGLNEVTIPIITMEEKEKISLAIWGLLPEEYNEDWTLFQNTLNTLNLNVEHMDSSIWYTEAYKQRRCLIPVTGFYTSYLRNGEMYPYYVGLKSGKPFYLAGIYNKLEDGFITCSVLVGKASRFIEKIQNLTDCMPLLISSTERSDWLSEETSLNRLKELLNSDEDDLFHAHPIAKEFFNNDISYDSMLLPYEYVKSNFK
ncbi:SOS response-associated peptidase [Maribacter aestuarii]|uniref:SOS response-associated peptidase n=1 Tax=Maribacter aestuarii TaxID=1130723 RepID=UPI00248B27CD|nr:SOS response-associated peptidase family protein [Maribacter aestuarii]